MDPKLTRWRWLDWFLVATLFGAGWTLGSALMAALLVPLSRGG